MRLLKNFYKPKSGEPKIGVSNVEETIFPRTTHGKPGLGGPQSNHGYTLKTNNLGVPMNGFSWIEQQSIN